MLTQSESPAEHLDTIHLTLSEVSLQHLTQPMSQENLNKLVVCNGQVFYLEQISGFDFAHHQQFYERISAFDPALAECIYTHNLQLKMLQQALLAVQQGQLSIGEAFREMVAALILGASCMHKSEPNAEQLQYLKSIADSFPG